MLLTQIKKIEDSAALLLTDEMLNLLGIGLGDEVEVSVVNHRLIIQSRNESERQRTIEKATNNVFKHRESVYQKLAKGVSEK